MKRQKIIDQSAIHSADIKSIIDSGEIPVIQFGIPDYSDQILIDVNELCIRHGELLKIRFYGHYGEHFDASCLEKLPNVRNLALECLHEIRKIESLYKLEELRALSFGVYEFDDKDFLSNFNFKHLTELSLIDNRKKNYNLSFLRKAKLLNTLFVDGLIKNLEVVSHLPELKRLLLGKISKKVSLDFLSRCENLKELELSLGGRENLKDVSISSLEVLRVRGVRGFNSLGNLSRFPKLNCLHVEDENKLESIDLSGCSLKRLLIDNCKSLKLLEGIDNQKNIVWLDISRTALDLDILKTKNWSSSLKVISITGSSIKWNEKCREYLDSKGYVRHPLGSNVEFD
ncbi:hypothetical protein RI845_17990 [Thalassotalea nanhaiensis]|uniref:Leucine-rich repeat domain-containing protein n=1 Tax=Thalassotalea nanhaiensis TaxID=3065648 RepID=A0ABY9TI05_9GAMM|nr:hypothetical protein RI845_17990 [Colwelliaceae bacterium SQ345]